MYLSPFFRCTLYFVLNYFCRVLCPFEVFFSFPGLFPSFFLESESRLGFIFFGSRTCPLVKNLYLTSHFRERARVFYPAKQNLEKPFLLFVSGAATETRLSGNFLLLMGSRSHFIDQNKTAVGLRISMKPQYDFALGFLCMAFDMRRA